MSSTRSIPLARTTEPDAELSSDVPAPHYRWWLTRCVFDTTATADVLHRPLVICGLNPSTADALKNDQTIRKEITFARMWGYGWLIKVNLYAYRSTKPEVMLRAARTGTDIIGDLNDRTIRDAAQRCRDLDGRFMVAWGQRALPVRTNHVVGLLGDLPLWCWGKNGNGSPEHPLYVPYERKPQRWIPREAA